MDAGATGRTLRYARVLGRAPALNNSPKQSMSEKGNLKVNAIYLAKAPPGAGPANLSDKCAQGGTALWNRHD